MNRIILRTSWGLWVGASACLLQTLQTMSAETGPVLDTRMYAGITVTGTITHSQANYQSSTNDTYDINSTPGYHPNYQSGEQPYTSPVGSFVANGYGVYDMSGNVSEWCWDLYGSFSSVRQSDPRGPFSNM